MEQAAALEAGASAKLDAAKRAAAEEMATALRAAADEAAAALKAERSLAESAKVAAMAQASEELMTSVGLLLETTQTEHAREMRHAAELQASLERAELQAALAAGAISVRCGGDRVAQGVPSSAWSLSGYGGNGDYDSHVSASHSLVPSRSGAAVTGTP